MELGLVRLEMSNVPHVMLQPSGCAGMLDTQLAQHGLLASAWAVPFVTTLHAGLSFRASNVSCFHF